jgi:acetoin utilization deacetylase AcuC-like enzyme
MDKIQFFYPSDHQNHFEYGHPERPERLFSIRDALIRESLWEQFKKIPATPISSKILSETHSELLISSIKQRSANKTRMDADTYLTNDSYQLAIQAAGGAISIAEAVWTKATEYGFAFCRPPGHHATKNQSMGFCLLNNISIAANHLIKNHNLERIAIIDIDVHHGNGTQDIFYKNKDVHFFSIHQSPYYPFTGSIDETGEGIGETFNTNIPLPPGAGDQSRDCAVEEIIIPLLERSKPEILLVSVGFDAHWKDPLANHLVTSKGYGKTIDKLAKWANKNCDGKLALFLEGGYDLQAGAESCVSIISALLEKQYSDILGKGNILESYDWKKSIKQIKLIWNL